ncbi:MAG: ABC transporter substrate-binding protein [Bryobacteraceae bacterium]
MNLRMFIAVAVLAAAATPSYAAGGELRACLRAEPKTLNPALVADDASETIRYLTGGVLIRVNRLTQALEPELARSWEVRDGGRTIRFQLRQGLRFSDGTPFGANDVAFTFRSLMAPETHSPTADSFRSGDGPFKATVTGPASLSLTFPAPLAGVERLFDQVAIVSARSPLHERAALGPFMIAEHKPGSYILLRRNPNYWKKDNAGRQLPYLDAVRLDIQQNREIELLRFQRGELHVIDSLEPDHFQRLAGSSAAKDVGPSLEGELLWFNQVPRAPLPDFKKAWFRSQNFRRAISESINRDDLCRVVYRGLAHPGIGPFSAANRFWVNAQLKPHPYDPVASLRRLASEGFHLSGDRLLDRGGHTVEFSLVTNAGNRVRERIGVMIQQDLRKIGVQLNLVTLDFPSLIERISRSYDYEACLLGLINVDLDPDAQMNVWLSSGPQHQWNPGQIAPETPWEADVDRLMKAQASAPDPKKRKADFDRVQEIVSEQAPFLYLANKDALVAVSPALHNVKPSVLRPQVLWNAEWLYLDEPTLRSAR